MTPKEKAVELVERFIKHYREELAFSNEELGKTNQFDCHYKVLKTARYYEQRILGEFQQVKQEIENL